MANAWIGSTTLTISIQILTYPLSIYIYVYIYIYIYGGGVSGGYICMKNLHFTNLNNTNKNI